MKKLYGTMFVTALFSSATVFAQDAPAKKFFIGGTAGFSSVKNEVVYNTSPAGTPPNFVVSEGSSTNTFNIAPEFGFYIKENVALGIKLGYSHTGGKNLQSSNSYVAAPFVRFNIPIGKSRFSVYNDLGLAVGYSATNEHLADGQPADAKTLNLGAFYEPGLQFRLKNNINLLATLGNLFNYEYHSKQVKPELDPTKKATSSGHFVGINNDFFAFNSFRIGVNFLF
ncbi:outer membrane beta-barrel protein [Chitinophaga niabensis]|uniref:Outer membrane protein beta-barrel domain-containing protein n=1 Tax=Chitinophaga niabensis TaxID=536979 RepID=A0A1N6E7W8_9BACT|nr:outer membrane beta-barrel protein [Chitinophaga niabensis]SIN79061.1 hypothetical protein SAMN04488055_1371 [Chitinophaga niabensis]